MKYEIKISGLIVQCVIKKFPFHVLFSLQSALEKGASLNRKQKTPNLGSKDLSLKIVCATVSKGKSLNPFEDPLKVE